MCKLFAHPGCWIFTTYLLARLGTLSIDFWTGVQKSLQANHRFAKNICAPINMAFLTTLQIPLMN